MLSSRRARLDDPLHAERSCVLSRGGMVCASVPAAAEAGASLLRAGGNAVDAAIAAAAALCVVEPFMTGVGGDAFALAWSEAEGRMLGLNGSGRAPAGASLEALRAAGHERVPEAGILSATVPGAVHAWETLHRRLGRAPLSDCLAPAVRLAEEGFPVTEIVAHQWYLTVRMGRLLNDAARDVFAPGGETPRAGSLFRIPALARTLREIALGGAAAFYEGPIADAIVATSEAQGGAFAHDDLRSHRSTWVEPLRAPYRDVTVAELPPNGQGIAALEALRVLDRFDAAETPPDSALGWHRRIEAIKLAFADRDAWVADPEHAAIPVDALLADGYAERRAARIGPRAAEAPPSGPDGDTVYLCTADREGNLVSFIQSLFGAFGSGLCCGDTGVVLQNRGACFRLEPGHPNALAPGKRPFHTIIPGMLLRDGAPWMAFGIMGGHVQPQAHVSFVTHVVDHGCTPQEALDAPRFRVEGGLRVRIERPGLQVAEGGTLGDALAARGHRVEGPGSVHADVFGGGQAIARLGASVLAGASDRRKDGAALGVP